jgi:hypothetical protein
MRRTAMIRIASFVACSVLVLAGAPECDSAHALAFKHYVDNFAEVIYDLDYRAERGRLSTWLQARYEDGTVIDINVDDIKAAPVSGSETRDLIAEFSIGAGGRIFPMRMDSATTPRLWAARQGAIAAMEELNHQFIMSAVPAVFIVISVAAQPPISAPARMGVPTVTRRTVMKSGARALEAGTTTSARPAARKDAAQLPQSAVVHPTAAIGAARVQRVVNHFGREVLETNRKVTIKGVGSTDIDVVLTGKRFCEVGGPSKAGDLGSFGAQLKKLKAYADQEGGTAYFYYDANTPQRAIELAMKWLGRNNVKPIP